MRPSRAQAIEMRWTLTWKVKDDGGVKAKAGGFVGISRSTVRTPCHHGSCEDETDEANASTACGDQ